MCATTIISIASTPVSLSTIHVIIDSILRPTHLDHFIRTLNKHFIIHAPKHQQEEDHTSFRQYIVDMANSSSWSTENATKAYLGALKMGKRGREPDVAEFISALAAGNNAQLMVEICSTETAGVLPTTLALVAAAQQTGGRVVCILPSDTRPEDLNVSISKELLVPHSGRVELIPGDPHSLLLDNYRQADFILFDCHANCLRDLAQRVAAQTSGGSGPLLVGYNALDNAGLPWTGTARAGGVLVKGLHYLPIGSGLVVGKAGGENKSSSRRSKWVVRVDKCTGEEHVFRIVSPHHKSSTVQA